MPFEVGCNDRYVATKGLDRRIVAQELPELARVENGQRRVLSNIEQVPIARHENIGLASGGSSQDPAIGGIADGEFTGCGRLGNHGYGSENGFHGVDAIGWELELGRERAPKLDQNNVAKDKVVLSKYGAEDVRAESASGEGGDENVGIKTDAHDLGDGVEDILIGEIAAGLSERHGLPARILKLEDRELATKRIAGNLAT
jgi:hypothetical protein